MLQYARIIIHFATPEEIDRFFTYKIESPLLDRVKAGQRVRVPFGRHNALQLAYVIEVTHQIEKEDYELKAVAEIVEEEPLLASWQLDMAKFMVDYYGASFAASLDVITPPGLTGKPFQKAGDFEEVISLAEDPDKVAAYIAENAHKKTFLKQHYLLEYLLSNKEIAFKEMKARNDFSLSALKTLMQNQFVIKSSRKITAVKDTIREDAFLPLNEEQRTAKNKIVAALQNKRYQTILLQGVTGSGKTEVFLCAIKEVLESNGAAIVLVPEIALTKQTLERFKERFGNQVALTHSRMTSKERQRLYIQAEKGEVSVVIGPRSAVFMPFKNLRLIVIDEEHESTYKSESAPKYHATDIAQMRMQKKGGVVLLASATPSLESYHKCEQGEYEKILLTQRIGRAMLPEVTIVDMREELRKGNSQVISRALFEAIQYTLTSDKQVMLLINRRGYSTFINCRSCGHVIKCFHCDVSMTYHLSSQTLECHYCGKKQEVPDKCPECGSQYIRFFGSGTEKVEAYLRDHFETYGIARMDFDTTSGKEGHSKILDAYREKKINILIGTQMIAKGHDFKDVTLAGIISADMSLYMQDFRSNERTFQLLTQAMGRSGRAESKGKVIIQTYNPDHIVLQRIIRESYFINRN